MFRPWRWTLEESGEEHQHWGQQRIGEIMISLWTRLLRPGSRVPPIQLEAVRWMAVVKGGKKAKAGGGPVKVKIFPVEKDTHKLVNFCYGLNYQLEGEEVALKPAEEYPDWLWTMNMKRPKPPARDMDPDTMEYYEKLNEEYQARKQRLISRSYTKPYRAPF
eukprot:maker-scaffold17_size721972-snap-gene-5.12 protein:Tk09973 transcript:maker-scaffold17_size721972-snap-gene-5.12-mRNA-1 annotation:"GH12746"